MSSDAYREAQRRLAEQQARAARQAALERRRLLAQAYTKGKGKK